MRNGPDCGMLFLRYCIYFERIQQLMGRRASLRNLIFKNWKSKTK